MENAGNRASGVKGNTCQLNSSLSELVICGSVGLLSVIKGGLGQGTSSGSSEPPMTGDVKKKHNRMYSPGVIPQYAVVVSPNEVHPRSDSTGWNQSVTRWTLILVRVRPDRDVATDPTRRKRRWMRGVTSTAGVPRG